MSTEIGSIRYNPAYSSSVNAAWFDPHTPELYAQAVTEGGRNAAWFIRYANTEGVLRHYKRGGLIAKLVSQSYVWLGAQRTRSWHEYTILSYLKNKGVPVPEPLAAYYHKCGLSYRAAIIVARIPTAVPIAQHLEQCSASAVARVIKQMHKAGVWHADLNVFNILIDQDQRIYLIDFDRAKLMTVVDSKHQENNLLRLRRSLIKVRGEIGQHWFEQLQQAYLQL